MSFSPQPTSSASDGSGSASTPTAGSATCLALLLDSEIEADLADALHVVLEPGGVTGHPPIERCLRGDRLRPESVNGCSSAADVARLTHVHNDYVTGGLELARRAGAAYVLSAGDEVAYEHIGASDGDEFAVGELVMRAVHTPGHARYQAQSI